MACVVCNIANLMFSGEHVQQIEQLETYISEHEDELKNLKGTLLTSSSVSNNLSVSLDQKLKAAVAHVETLTQSLVEKDKQIVDLQGVCLVCVVV